MQTCSQSLHVFCFLFFVFCAQKSNKSLSRQGLALSLGLSLALLPSLTQRVAMPSLFLHRISLVYVYLSIAATTPDPAGQDPCQFSIVNSIKCFTDNKGQNAANYFQEKDVTDQGGKWLNWLHSILGRFSTDFRKLKILSKHLLPQFRVRGFQQKQVSQQPMYNAGLIPHRRTCP